MLAEAPVIFYQYAASPYAHKVNNILLLKGVRHAKVSVSPVLPRPELSNLLGINYRRIPLLAIGNDVWCDTNLISTVLERRYNISAGYDTIFPPVNGGKSADTGMIKAFSQAYGASLFPLATQGFLDWSQLPKAFLKDREELLGGGINPEVMAARRPIVASTLAAQLFLIEEQLADGRQWLFNTVSPSLADISVHFILAWIQSFPSSKGALDWSRYPKVAQWIAALSKLLKEKKSQHASIVSKISGEDAAKVILGSKPDSFDDVSFNSEDAARLGLKLGDVVAIAPEDTGKSYPTVGKLVGLNEEQSVIEIQPSAGGYLRCHFPRIGYTIRKDVKSKL